MVSALGEKGWAGEEGLGEGVGGWQPAVLGTVMGRAHEKGRSEQTLEAVRCPVELGKGTANDGCGWAGKL